MTEKGIDEILYIESNKILSCIRDNGLSVFLEGGILFRNRDNGLLERMINVFEECNEMNKADYLRGVKHALSICGKNPTPDLHKSASVLSRFGAI